MFKGTRPLHHHAWACAGKRKILVATYWPRHLSLVRRSARQVTPTILRTILHEQEDGILHNNNGPLLGSTRR
jgi:hypothetical protein